MAGLRHSAADWCFFRKGYDAHAYYRHLRDIGYQGVEMVDRSRWQAAREAGLEIVNLSGPGMQRGINRVEHHSELIDELGKVIELAGTNGIGQVIVFSGNRQGQADEEGIANCGRALAKLEPQAAKAGVTLVFEMLNGFDHPDYQADNSSYGFEVARGVGSPAVKVLYDVYHMHRMSQKLLQTMLANVDLIAHIHVAGSPKRDFPAADGEIDYRRIVRELTQAGYGGYWGQEFLPGGDSLEELKRAHELFESYAT